MQEREWDKQDNVVLLNYIFNKLCDCACTRQRPVFVQPHQTPEMITNVSKPD